MRCARQCGVDLAEVGALERAHDGLGAAGGVQAAGQARGGLVAAFAGQEVEHGAAEQRRVADAGGRVGRRALVQRRRIAGRRCSTWPAKYWAAPWASHAQRSRRTNVATPNGGGAPGC